MINVPVIMVTIMDTNEDLLVFEDWKKIEIMGSNLVKRFAKAFDIVYHKDEEELRKQFDNPCMEKPDIEQRVKKLNTLYHTRLLNSDIDRITNYLVSEGDVLENRIKSGEEDVVKFIAHSGDENENSFAFATKYCSFMEPDGYPIYDSLVTKTLSYFHKKKPLIKGYLKFENIRQECDYKRYKNIVKEFRKQ